jgi:hypothetical protein
MVLESRTLPRGQEISAATAAKTRLEGVDGSLHVKVPKIRIKLTIVVIAHASVNAYRRVNPDQ